MSPKSPSTRQLISTRRLSLVLMLPRLTALKLDGLDITDAHLASLTQAKSLVRLGLRKTWITEQAAARLAANREWQFLDVSGWEVSQAAIQTLRQADPRHRYPMRWSSPVKDGSRIVQIGFVRRTRDPSRRRGSR